MDCVHLFIKNRDYKYDKKLLSSLEEPYDSCLLLLQNNLQLAQCTGMPDLPHQLYNLMILLIFGCSVLGISILVSLTMCLTGMDQSNNYADRVVTILQPTNILALFLRFSRMGSGPLAGLLGCVTLIGKILCFQHHYNKSYIVRQEGL